jgi:hypothetical protein
MNGEISLAIEMGAEGTDTGKTIHPRLMLGELVSMEDIQQQDSGYLSSNDLG